HNCSLSNTTSSIGKVKVDIDLNHFQISNYQLIIFIVALEINIFIKMLASRIMVEYICTSITLQPSFSKNPQKSINPLIPLAEWKLSFTLRIFSHFKSSKSILLMP